MSKSNAVLEPEINDTMLTLLYQQKENFPSLDALCSGSNITIGTFFLPQTIKLIDSKFDTNTNLIHEALGYLDLVKFFSLIHYNDVNYFTDNVAAFIVDNRTVTNYTQLLNQANIGDFIFQDKIQSITFLDSNKLLLSIYIFLFISFISFHS